MIIMLSALETTLAGGPFADTTTGRFSGAIIELAHDDVCSLGATVKTQQHAQLPPTPIAQRAMLGAFTYGGIWRGIEPVLRLEADLGRRLDVVHWFTNWSQPYFPEMVAMASAAGRKALISWQPHDQSIADIARGLYDDYIWAWADGVRESSVIVYLRPFPEMNGDWVPWNGEPELFRAAWRRMAAIFDLAGADNVRWVFSPNVTDSPRTEENRFEHYYPGADVVDVLALDGYNWGTTRAWTAWRSFEDVFSEGYDRIAALGDQGIWFAEMASSPDGGDKAAWVSDMLASTAFPRVEALIWFDEHKEADWRMVADDAVALAFRAGTRAAELAAR
ncbi:MAG TPA: glycosyl hydrolase [Trueperaceae bacterium]|nr:glycosyl hydrolase [Trueperaceae bacterium]